MTIDPVEPDPDLRLVPVDDDIDTGGFFDAARRGAVAVRRCNGCDAVLHVPRAHCRHCGSWDGRWHDVAPRGSLYSWTTVTHQVHPAHRVPYTIVLVDLDDFPGTRLIGSIPGAPDLRAGEAMEAWFEHIADVDGRRVVVPNWRPAR